MLEPPSPPHRHIRTIDYSHVGSSWLHPKVTSHQHCEEVRAHRWWPRRLIHQGHPPRRMGVPIPLPCKLVLRYRDGVSKCPIQPNDLTFPKKRRVTIDHLAFMPCTKNCVIVGKTGLTHPHDWMTRSYEPSRVAAKAQRLDSVRPAQLPL